MLPGGRRFQCPSNINQGWLGCKKGVKAKKLGSFEYKAPISIETDRLLNDAQQLFRQTNVDTIMVTDNGKPVGMLDIQDLKA